VGDWRDVAVALDTLGDSIARATVAAVENEEIRTRLRDLAEGLAALALRVSATLGEISGSSEVDSRPLARPYAPAPADQFRPQVLDAVGVANEKFRRAAEDWDSPTQEMAPVAPVRAPIVAGAVAPVAFGTPGSPLPAQSAAASFAAAPTVAMPPVAPAAPARSAAAGMGLSPDRLAAVKAASERFAAERREAEEAAAVAATAPAPEPFAPAPDGIDAWLDAAPADEIAVVEPVAAKAPAGRAPRKPKAPAPEIAAVETPPTTPAAGSAPAAPAAAPRAKRKPKAAAQSAAGPEPGGGVEDAQVAEAPVSAPKAKSRGRAGTPKAAL
jgi:hypothetical protein